MLIRCCCTLLIAGATCLAASKEQDVVDPTIQELRTMVEADQKDGRAAPTEADDLAHQKRVLELLVEGRIHGPEAQTHAALILQHTPLFFCDGSTHSYSRDNYYIAYLLAKSAADQGRKSALGLAAAALDRYLINCEKPQKFGTQFTYFSAFTKKWVVYPIDPSTTDAERASWNVPPLRELEKINQEIMKNQKKD